MITFDDILNEAKKKEYDIDNKYAITKVGHDTNGNWSYWVINTLSGKKTKIQHGSFEPTGSKITKDDIKQWNKDDHKKVIKDMLKYIKDHTKI